MYWLVICISVATVVLTIILFKPIKEKFCFKHERRMNQSDLEDWDDGPIRLYNDLIRDEYDRYNRNEDEINLRSTSLLAVEGVILTLMVAFLNPVKENHTMLVLFVISISLIFMSILFIIWTIRPSQRSVLDLYSHRIDYHECKKNELGLRKKILHDMLIFVESIKEIQKKKVSRFAYALYFFMASMFSLIITFFISALI